MTERGDEPADPLELVRRGYDVLSRHYREDDAEPARYAPWIAELSARLPQRARVLDLCCGCGVPVARDLVAAGHDVTGVDISEVQVERARRLVPGATFLQADATALDFPAGSFDAVVALYSLIHMPQPAQRALIASMVDWLADGGVLLLVAGAAEWTGLQQDWLGGDAPMWWSHPGAQTYREWLGEAGFDVEREEFVPEGDGGHALFWASRRRS